METSKIIKTTSLSDAEPINITNTSIWKIDTNHSHIDFRVKHLMVTSIGGYFNIFDATMECHNEGFANAKVSFEAEVNSITTGNEMRDGHLKSEDFFNTASYPKLTFVSTDIKKIDDENYKLTGDLTIRDKTLPVSLDVVHGGTTLNFYGKTVAGFELSGKINRKDFGLKWSATTEAGNVVVSDEVKLSMVVEMVKQD
ncbi:MAG TPA: YceI family protein [Bacteroidia bacterium]|nr:YceI family protein [Bacteroidia bacterium]